MKLFRNTIGYKMVAVMAVISMLSWTPGMAQHRRNEPKWQLEAGPAYRGGMKIEGSGSSYVQQLQIQAARSYQMIAPRLVGEGPPVIANPDDITLPAPHRKFDDGDVYEEPGVVGVTRIWGYTDIDQYDPAADTMTFQRRSQDTVTEEARGTQRSVAVNTDFSGPFSDDVSLDALGFGVNLKYAWMTGRDADVSLILGMRGFFGMKETLQGTTFRQTVTERDFAVIDRLEITDHIVDTYVYNTISGAALILPPQDFTGMPGDAIIENVPNATTRAHTRDSDVIRNVTQTRQTVWTAANDIRIDADADLYQFAMGARVSMHAGERVSLSAQTSLSLNYLDAEVKRSEQFIATYQDRRNEVLNAWHDRKSVSEWLPGIGIELGVDVSVTERISLGVRGGYELIDKASVNIGPNKVEMDFSGYTASAVVGFNF